MTIRNLKLASVVALVLSPALMLAQTGPTQHRQSLPASYHQRSQTFHDRGARPHDDRGTTLHH